MSGHDYVLVGIVLGSIFIGIVAICAFVEWIIEDLRDED